MAITGHVVPSQLLSDPKSTPAAPARAARSSERSPVARAAVLAGMAGGLTINAVDLVRLLKKYPEALRAGAFDPNLGRLGRLPTALGLTAMLRPDSRIIDPAAPRVATIASLGKSFTRFDELMMRTSVLLGSSLAAVQVLSAVPNLADAMSREGSVSENLLGTNSGRAGLLQLAGGGLGLGVFATALRSTTGSGTRGVVPRVLEAARSPIMAKPIWGRIGMGTAYLVLANELHYLDFLNAGETRPVGQVLTDAARRTPILNDQPMRTAALAGAGGVIGFKAARSMASAGGVSGLRPGHLIASAVVAGLIGANLVGALHGLDAGTPRGALEAPRRVLRPHVADPRAGSPAARPR